MTDTLVSSNDLLTDRESLLLTVDEIKCLAERSEEPSATLREMAHRGELPGVTKSSW